MVLWKFAARCAAKRSMKLLATAAVTLIAATAAAQTPQPGARHETNASRQARIQRTITDTYSHRWEVFGGGGYMRFRSGEYTQKNNEVTWNLAVHYFLNPKLSIVADSRGMFGNGKPLRNEYVAENPNPQINQYAFTGGASYRFYSNLRYALSAQALGGVGIEQLLRRLQRPHLRADRLLAGRRPPCLHHQPRRRHQHLPQPRLPCAPDLCRNDLHQPLRRLSAEQPRYQLRNRLPLRPPAVASGLAPEAYHRGMSKGWESKNVEEQQAQQAASSASKPEGEPTDAASAADRKRRIQALEMQRERVLSERTSSPHRRSALSLALATIERELEQLGWSIKI